MEEDRVEEELRRRGRICVTMQFAKLSALGGK
jgi:hypothetical protein